MIIGVPKEQKMGEFRVACTPGGAQMLIKAGHGVKVQTEAGVGAGYTDEAYRGIGAEIVESAAEAWSADLVLKIKEPVASEYGYLRDGLLLFTYLHLAASRELTLNLLESGTTAIAYETVQIGHKLPLLEPMSELAGRMSTSVGAYYLGRHHGGKGVLLGGVPGVLPGRVVILGGGTAGINAGRVATALGSEVTILEIDVEKMRYLDLLLQGAAHTLYSNEQNLLGLLPRTDILIGSVLIPGAKAPKLVRKDMLSMMQPGSVFVDIAIDQGGCADSSRPTTHADPIYLEQDIIHYCVANMPGAYPRTATQAITNVTLPYALTIANMGLADAIQQFPELGKGLNTTQGQLTCEPVAQAHDLDYVKPDTIA